jgi:hypothetical protein
MKLIDCTLYTGKPKGGIPGTAPGVYGHNQWRVLPDDVLSMSETKLHEWLDTIPRTLPILIDVEPIFVKAEALNFSDPISAYWQVRHMLTLIRRRREDLKLWIYVGGRFWGYVDKKLWSQHPQVLLRTILVSRMYDDALCDGIAAESYPPRWEIKDSAGRVIGYDEARTIETMGIFFSRLRGDLSAWTNETPIMPVLGTHFLTGSAHHKMLATTFKGVLRQCTTVFPEAMVCGGIKFKTDQKYERHLRWEEHSDLFEEAKP